jgi:hypothetical protein
MNFNAKYKTSYELNNTNNSNLNQSVFTQPSNIPHTNLQPTQHNNNKMQIKWETKDYSSTSNPDVWGPSFWFILHLGSIKYPLNPSPLAKGRMKNFIIGIPIMVTCDSCREHATAFIESNMHNLDDICSSRDKLFKFFVDFHNKVNKRYGKRTYSYDEAYKLYTNGAQITKMSYK